MKINELLNQFVLNIKEILKDNIVGVYLHGSYAMGCYNSNISDIDLIVVIQFDISNEIKLLLMENILKCNEEIGSNGLEISFVKKEFCNKIIYPVPYELHFSKIHLENYINNRINYVNTMKGLDKDLTTHFKMIYHRGKTLYGRSIQDVFVDISDEYYLKSILNDIKDYKEEIQSNQNYVVLNLCRTLAYVKEKLILSKQEGGEWALINVDKQYKEIIINSISSYKLGSELNLTKSEIEKFLIYMLKEINKNRKRDLNVE